MADAVLTQQDRPEALSRAYVQAVAAGAGYLTSRPDVDRDSVDLTIAAGGQARPRLDLQLKATVNLRRSGSAFSYPLKLKNYNDLRASTQTPRLLVVFDMPMSESDWMTVTLEELVLRKAAYWLSLRGAPETENVDSVSVSIPLNHVFDVNGLRALMEQSRGGVVG